MSTKLPIWLSRSWDRLLDLRDQEKVPSALLITGPALENHGPLGEAFAQALLCTEPTESGACGQCQSCRWFEAGTHPDFYPVMPEEAGKAIKVDAIRVLTEQLSQASHQGLRQVILMRPAEALNRAAANALLKTLEEPHHGIHFLLMAEQPALLPATILSRCQQMACPLPSRSEALNWLASQSDLPEQDLLLSLAEGVPQRVLQWAKDKTIDTQLKLVDDLQRLAEAQTDCVQLAQEWKNESLPLVLTRLQTCLTALIQTKLTGENSALSLRLPTALARCSFPRVWKFWDALLQLQSRLQAQYHPALQLSLEGLFFDWQRVFAR